MSWPVALMAAAAVFTRGPAERQALVDLAYVLGEAHALRQVCSGLDDQAWRERMNRMMELEKPDDGLSRRLVDAFNAGFMTRHAEHPACDPGVAEAERATAQRGQALAGRLAAAP
ncbi:MAG TPA: TIGR02301 family protein [Caulobacteraceae bacterium]|jgi:uncharacterized protein (TIGR02301 family)|nr:TIGR02301 family protein [Caulobacteraceae bacterium]